MKRAILFAVPFALALMLATSIRADDKPAAKEGEWTGTVGCGHCAYSKDTGATACCAAVKVADKVYTLKGDKVAKDYKKGGEYVIKGKITDDGKAIEVTEMKKKEG